MQKILPQISTKAIGQSHKKHELYSETIKHGRYH